MLLTILRFEISTSQIVLFYLTIQSPAILMLIIGLVLKKNKKSKAAKILFILAGIFFIIGNGYCGGMF